MNKNFIINIPDDLIASVNNEGSIVVVQERFVCEEESKYIPKDGDIIFIEDDIDIKTKYFGIYKKSIGNYFECYIDCEIKSLNISLNSFYSNRRKISKATETEEKILNGMQKQIQLR